MASQVWIRRKANLCEVCGRVMDFDEIYVGRCENCDSDFCRSCKSAHGVCSACEKSSLFLAGLPALG